MSCFIGEFNGNLKVYWNKVIPFLSVLQHRQIGVSFVKVSDGSFAQYLLINEIAVARLTCGASGDDSG